MVIRRRLPGGRFAYDHRRNDDDENDDVAQDGEVISSPVLLMDSRQGSVSVEEAIRITKEAMARDAAQRDYDEGVRITKEVMAGRSIVPVNDSEDDDDDRVAGSTRGLGYAADALTGYTSSQLVADAYGERDRLLTDAWRNPRPTNSRAGVRVVHNTVDRKPLNYGGERRDVVDLEPVYEARDAYLANAWRNPTSINAAPATRVDDEREDIADVDAAYAERDASLRNAWRNR